MTNSRFENLPGAELISQGIADLRQGVETVPALLVAVGAPRLEESLGKLADRWPAQPELRLYRLLRQQTPDEAYGQYNALLRRLTSFCRALESRRRE